MSFPSTKARKSARACWHESPNIPACGRMTCRQQESQWRHHVQTERWGRWNSRMLLDDHHFGAFCSRMVCPPLFMLYRGSVGIPNRWRYILPNSDGAWLRDLVRLLALKVKLKHNQCLTSSPAGCPPSSARPTSASEWTACRGCCAPGSCRSRACIWGRARRGMTARRLTSSSAATQPPRPQPRSWRTDSMRSPPAPDRVVRRTRRLLDQAQPPSRLGLLGAARQAAVNCCGKWSDAES